MLEPDSKNPEGIPQAETSQTEDGEIHLQKAVPEQEANVIGAGIAGTQASLTLARFGIKTNLYEMRSGTQTPAHRTGNPAELVCSNSLGSFEIDRAKGLLLAELEMAGARLPAIFKRFKIPAGQAFAVDSAQASEEILKVIDQEENINFHRREIDYWPGSNSIIATGPLTSPAFMSIVSKKIGQDCLHFFDAISPSIYLDSMDLTKAYFASRYGKGTPDYLNIPLDENEYDELIKDLQSAERTEIREYEPDKLFESCLPIEVLARRGRMSAAFGPLKPKGLDDPNTGKRPFAVIQLRRENLSGDIYNIVGFQTRLKHSEQKRVLMKIPALRNAKFARLGSMHLNSYIEAPEILNHDLSMKIDPTVFFAGQLSGGEGYLEAIATGFYCGLNLYRKMNGSPEVIPPTETMSGSLLRSLTSKPVKNFKPQQAQFGLMPEYRGKERGRHRKMARAKNALFEMEGWLRKIGVEPAEITFRDE